MSESAFLDQPLECALLAALAGGAISETFIQEEDLSGIGAKVYRAIMNLKGRDVPPPYGIMLIQLAATSVLGYDEAPIVRYLRDMTPWNPDANVTAILEAARDRVVLNNLIDEAARQLGEGRLDTTKLTAAFKGKTQDHELVSLASLVGDDLPEPPSGPAIKGLPLLTKASGGMFDLWAIAGGPGLGKSTLALQVALAYQQHGPVLYYDFENGVEALAYRLRLMCGDSTERMRRLARRLYIRTSISTLETDLQCVGERAMIIIDSVQKLPTMMKYRRTGLDEWIHRFEALKQRGYFVLMLSEVNRSAYQTAHMGAYKDSGEVEYSATFGMQMLASEMGTGMVDCIVVKNRHRPTKGFLSSMLLTEGMYFEEQQSHTNTDQSKEEF